MRLTDKLVEKFGADKLLHFFVAAWLVAECKNYGIITGFFGWIAVIILSALKEFSWMENGARWIPVQVLMVAFYP